MNDRENRRYEMFSRVEAFGKANGADFAPTSDALKHFSNVGGVITELTDEKATQAAGASVTAKSVLLDALRLDQRAIARTALAYDQDQPGFADLFPSPNSSSDRDLLTTVDLYLSRLQPNGTTDAALAAKFITKELPADFVQHLADDRAALSDEGDSIESDSQDGVASTSAIGRLIKEGMKEVNYLDAIMNNKYARNADKLRAWNSASHIERAPVRAKKAVLQPTAPQ